MKKRDIYALRAILEDIEINVHQDRNNDNQKSKTLELVKRGVGICNSYTEKMRPLR